jgi:hypothetical protein
MFSLAVASTKTAKVAPKVTLELELNHFRKLHDQFFERAFPLVTEITERSPLNRSEPSEKLVHNKPKLPLT